LFPEKIEDYIKVYKGYLNDEICDHAVKELKESPDWQTHTFYNMNKDSYHSTDKELSVLFQGNKEKDITATEYFMEQTWNVIERYIVKDHSFCKDYYDSWAGFTMLRYNRYSENTNMKLHCDHIHDMFDGERKGIPTLSIVANLNDDYEGGEFVMRGEVIPLGKGDIILFPSNFLYPHKVNDTTKGTRYSYVSWVW